MVMGGIAARSGESTIGVITTTIMAAAMATGIMIIRPTATFSLVG
jgi:hypothetical protein